MHGRRIGDAMGKLQLGRRIVMSMSLCLSVSVPLKPCPNFTKFSEHVTHGRGSVLLWRRSNTLCTSGFMDELLFYIILVAFSAPRC